LPSGQKGDASQSEGFRPDGVKRLSIAIINHAVLDPLENGRHSSEAERWRLCRGFDRIHNLLGEIFDRVLPFRHRDTFILRFRT
jgi:hypothetical protein